VRAAAGARQNSMCTHSEFKECVRSFVKKQQHGVLATRTCQLVHSRCCWPLEAESGQATAPYVCPCCVQEPDMCDCWLCAMHVESQASGSPAPPRPSSPGSCCV
jgi:hypothetical protein